MTDTTNFSVTRGDTLVLQFDSKEADGTTPSNLTGYTNLWFLVKRSKLDADNQAIVTKQLGSGITIDSIVHSRAYIRLESSDTNSLTIAGDSQDLYYDLQTKDGSGDVHTPQRGTLTVEADITRAN